MNKKLRTSWMIYAFAGLASVCAILFLTLPAAAWYVQTNLVSDIPGLAINTDPHLVNPWGIAFTPSSPFWVSNNGTGVATLYNGAGQRFPLGNPLVVIIPPPAGGSPPSKPTGVVFNNTTGFELNPGLRAVFLFAAEDGTISGWNPGVNPTVAILKVDNSGSGAVYKGLALGNNGSGNFLYAANFAGARIDVFDGTFNAAALAGSFTDPNLPAGYTPFNVQNIGGSLLVTYAVIDVNTGEEVTGAGLGIVDKFDLNGNLLQRLVSPGGALNAPWGLALAPASFGEFGGDLLVGNFGDGTIHAFDPVTGVLKGTLMGENGNPIVNEGLWGLIFGNGGNGGDPNTLYFTAGIDDEMHGLFGSIAVPLPSTVMLLGSGLAGLLTFARVRKRRA